MSVEILSIKRTGTGYAVDCVERDENEVPIPGSGFPEHVLQSNVGGLTEKEQATVDAAWLILEQHAAVNFDAKKEEPAVLHNLIAEAARAEERKKAAEDAALTLEAQNAAKAAEVAAVDLAIAQKQAELSALEVQAVEAAKATSAPPQSVE